MVDVVLFDQLTLVLSAHQSPGPSDRPQWYNPIVRFLDVEIERGGDCISLAASALKRLLQLTASLNHRIRLKVGWQLCLCYLLGYLKRGILANFLMVDEGMGFSILFHLSGIITIRVIYTFFPF